MIKRKKRRKRRWRVNKDVKINNLKKMNCVREQIYDDRESEIANEKIKNEDECDKQDKEEKMKEDRNEKGIDQERIKKREGRKR